MTAQPILELLIAAGLTVDVRPDGRLTVRPSDRITSALDVHIRTHRDELIAALSGGSVSFPPDELAWPPPEPSWFASWMEEDDRRRATMMAAGKARLARR